MNQPIQLQDRPAQPKPEIGQLLIVIRKWKPRHIFSTGRTWKKGGDSTVTLLCCFISEIIPTDNEATQMISRPGAQMSLLYRKGILWN
jgi:hypothetical protein